MFMLDDGGFKLETLGEKILMNFVPNEHTQHAFSKLNNTHIAVREKQGSSSSVTYCWPFRKNGFWTVHGGYHKEHNVSWYKKVVPFDKLK